MNIAIYARQSVDKKDSLSIQSQINDCKRFIEIKYKEENNISVYQDKGFSGKNTERPDLQKLLEQIEQGKIEKIVVYKLDRISRNVLDFYNLHDFMKKHNCTFSSVHDNFDTETQNGRLIMGILITFAEMERENIQMRVKTSYYDRAETDGRWLGGRTPFGYDLSKTPKGLSTLKENDESNIVDVLFQKYAYDTECSLHKLVEYLYKNYEIVKTATAINNILSNPIYCKADKKLYNYYKALGCNLVNEPEEWNGTHACAIINKTDQTGNKKVPNPPEEWTVYITNWQGFVESRTFLLCQERLSQNIAFSRDITPKGAFKELSGLVKCGKCGRAVKIKGKYGSMSCIGRSELRGVCDVSFRGIRLEQIQQKVQEEIQIYLNEFEKNQKKWKRKRDRLQAKIDKLTLEIDNLVNTLAENAVLGQTLLPAIEKRQKELADASYKMQLDIAPSDKIEYRVLRLLEQADPDLVNVYNVKYDKLDTEQKQALLKILVDKIYLNEDGTIKIDWKE